MRRRRLKNRLLGLALMFASGLTCTSAVAQVLLDLGRTRLKQRADAVMSLMAYSVVPDLASSNLSIKDASTENPSVQMAQLGGGFTLSKSVPLYLEGAVAYSRYDPTFVASEGGESRQLPARWNTVTGTIGVGWDFPITSELVFRPIVDVSLGKVASDLKVAQYLLGRALDRNIEFLDGGSMNAYGLGGAVMLDWEHVRESYSIDVELRYTDIRLQTFGNTFEAVSGNASARTANIWARYRAPTGAYMLDRPLRYVLEFSHSRYLGSQSGILGFDYLSSLGTGLELDTSKSSPLYVTRLRAVLRYMFGNNVSGVSLGLAASF
ncbi:hypothetical protein [Variovorax soli]|uniref:hypothetical protein n=1 Tax=Variovorax soli TaxID=376815 RepID=UPI0012946890|nr:hypothetical protein [Variovorax soli]